MSPLTSRRALDPRWSWHHRSVAVGHMPGVCEIFRRTGDVNDYGWNAQTGEMTGGELVLIYRGQCRLTVNKDWRARIKTARGDTGIQHAVRIQVPERQCQPVHAYDLFRIIDCPPDQELTHYIFHIRNVIPSANAWLRNCLGDVDVAHPKDLPPPRTAPVVQNVAAPVDCGCGC